MTGYTWYWTHWGLTIAAMTCAWRLGGMPERQAVIALVIGHALTLPAMFFSDSLVAGIDGGVCVALIGLSVLHRRWWLIIAAGSCVLLMAAHFSAILDNAILRRAYVLYRFMPGLLVLAAVALSPIERWLASESRLKCLFTWRCAPKRRARPTAQ